MPAHSVFWNRGLGALIVLLLILSAMETVRDDAPAPGSLTVAPTAGSTLGGSGVSGPLSPAAVATPSG